MEFEIEKVNTYKKDDLVEIVKGLHSKLAATSATPDEKDAQIEDLKSQLEAKTEEAVSLTEAVTELNKALASVEKGAKAKEIIEIDGVQYAFTCGRTRYQNAIVTAETLRQQPDLARELVEIGFGYLVKI